MRLFVALELTGDARDRATALLVRLASGLAGWRFVRPEGLHVTLRFLGEVDEATDRRARSLWREAARAAAPFRLRAGGLGTFPEGRRARVLWLGVSEEPPGIRLASLAASLEDAARAAGLRPESRRFHAHVTLARAAGRPDPLPERERAALAGGLDAREIVLFRSVIARAGARYEALERFPLGDGAAASAIVPRGPEP